MLHYSLLSETPFSPQLSTSHEYHTIPADAMRICRYEFLNVNIIFWLICNTDKISKLKAIYNMIARSLSHLPDILSQTPDAANLQSVCAYNVKIYHGGDREFVLSHFSASFARSFIPHVSFYQSKLCLTHIYQLCEKLCLTHNNQLL